MTTSYTYDDVYRLQRLQHVGGAVPEDLQYEYTPDDEIAKITSAYGSTALPTTKTVGTADAANRIASFNGSGQVFDNEGQPASSGTQSYNWDARGRLTQATASGQTVSYAYDALGRRTSHTDTIGAATFQYDGADVVMDRQGAATVDYVNGPGMDEKLRQGGTGGTLYFQQDHLGSVIGLTSAVNERPQYEAFGRNSNSSATRYGFTGRERDAQTGLLYYRARWYDAGQGRFLSEDPVGYEGGFNLYGYVDNTPLNYSDPNGYNPLLVGAAVGAAAGALVGGGIAAARGGGWGDVGRGAAEGAIGGAVAGATLGLGGGAIAGMVGGGYPGAILAGAVGGIVGDIASQMFGMAMGWRCKFDWGELAGAAALGGLLGAAGRALGGRLPGGRPPSQGDLPGLPKSAPKPLGRGNTGRTTPGNLNEQLAMEQAMSDPGAGSPIPLKNGMTDPRWPATNGWFKMRQNINGIEIHYVRNPGTGAVDDFKFK